MLKNYLKIALRNLIRRKGYTFINIAGLALGIAVCVLIVLYVMDEVNYDRFHEDSDRIYRLVETQTFPGDEVRYAAQTAAAVGETMVETFPDVETATRVFSLWRTTIEQGPNRFYEGEYLFADPNFFDVFSFELIQGDPATALAEPRSVVLTETGALKYFGDEDPMGKTIQTDLVRDDGLMTVTGVIQDPPLNSHLQFSMLFPSHVLAVFDFWEDWSQSWESNQFITYVKLAESAPVAEITTKLKDLAESHWESDESVSRTLALQALGDVHFQSGHIATDLNAGKADPMYLYIFSAIALFIVLIACINYMNLATARSIGRAREVGLRKVIGAYRMQLVRQFLSESVLTVVLASILAFALIQMLLPGFNTLTAKEIALEGATAVGIFGVLIGLALILGIVSGSYPAFHLSRFSPAQVLKGSQNTGRGAARLRRVLVVAQFALSIIMIVSTVVVYYQLEYIQNKELGFESEQRLVVDINSGVARGNFKTMKQEFSRIPAVKSVSSSSRVPGDWKNIPQIQAVQEGQPIEDTRTVSFLGVDEDFLDTFEIKLVEGRNFSVDMATDSNAVLLNEAAVELFGFSTTDVLDRIVRVPSQEYEARVVGVVQDFHFRSLHEQIGPLILGHWNNPVQAIDYFTILVDGRDLAGTISQLEQAHYSVDEQTLFELNFLDQRMNDFYQSEQRVGRLFGLAAVLAILIACLGLFGLAAFTTEQRTKEIGLRKVLGASVSGIIVLLSKDFVRLMILAFVIAVPVAYFTMHRWLDAFAYRIELSWPIFAVSGAMALSIALLTVSFQAVKAAMSNPVDALRYE